jgi:alpha-glucosidase (family GH31 glycosyl hydrolase)
MPNDILLELHSRRLTDFQIRRIIRASDCTYEQPITAYLSDVFVSGSIAYGVVYGHTNKCEFGRFADGHFMHTSSIRFVKKEGRFWVITTMNSRYVVASFQRLTGRPSFKAFMQSAAPVHLVSPI